MSRRRVKGIIIVVAAFYVFVAVMALVLLQDKDSVLAEKTMAEILFEKESGEKTTENKVTEENAAGSEDPDAVLEKWTMGITEGATEAVTGAPSVNPGETLTEVPSGTPGETLTEAPSGTPGETLTEAPAVIPGETFTEAPAGDAVER